MVETLKQKWIEFWDYVTLFHVITLFVLPLSGGLVWHSVTAFKEITANKVEIASIKAQTMSDQKETARYRLATADKNLELTRLIIELKEEVKAIRRDTMQQKENCVATAGRIRNLEIEIAKLTAIVKARHG